MNPEHFFIAGVQKCGTSTLHTTLASHPDVNVALNPATGQWVKEVNYFDQHWGRGFDWYASHFRSSERRWTLDATPNYICDPETVARIAKVFPRAKVIISLRDPVARAISAHNHYCQLFPQSQHWDWRMPGESFDDNIQAELEDPFPQWRGFIARGHYFDQLEYLTHFFPPNQLHVVIMEQWSENPEDSLKQILDFLGLDQQYNVPLKISHRREHTARGPSESVRQQLREMFREPNEKLFTWLGQEIPSWSS